MHETTVRAWVLEPNQPADRFYAGGERIAAFRGRAHAQPHTPEDWVASVTALFGEEEAGRTRLPSGELLAEAIASDPEGWLGPEHVARWGADPHLLVKLLHAGQRLPVHAHPDVPFASHHLGMAHGKTEAWVFLEPAPVWLGWSRDVDDDEVAGWVARQDVAAMLDSMHRLECDAGDAVLVPAGTPHAIGEGALIVEVQEPTDLSVLMEWKGFAIDGASNGHLGLGFDVALRALRHEGHARSDIEALRESRAPHRGSLLPGAAPYFRAERWRGTHSWSAGYSVVVAVGGTGVMRSEQGDDIALARGMTVVTPYGSGEWNVVDDGDLEVLRCRPPAPSVGEVY